MFADGVTALLGLHRLDDDGFSRAVETGCLPTPPKKRPKPKIEPLAPAPDFDEDETIWRAAMDRQFARGASAWQDAWLDDKLAARDRRRRLN